MKMRRIILIGLFPIVFLGFIDSSIFALTEEIPSQQTGIKGEPIMMAQKRRQEWKDRLEYLQNDPSVDVKTRYAIMRELVFIGMRKEMALVSWGHPTRINETITRFGKSEQWVYESTYGRMQLLYFENGILKSFQNIGFKSIFD